MDSKEALQMARALDAAADALDAARRHIGNATEADRHAHDEARGQAVLARQARAAWMSKGGAK